MRTTQDLMLSSFTWLEDYQKANGVSKQPKKVIMQVWKPVTNGNMILNVDAAFLSNQHHGGIGGILRDSAGNSKLILLDLSCTQIRLNYASCKQKMFLCIVIALKP